MVQFNCPSTDEWVNKMWHIHTVKYYLAKKRNHVLTYSNMEMDGIGNSVLSERCQSLETTEWMTTFDINAQNTEINGERK